MTFEENFLFETYKDTALKGGKHFREKIKDFKKVDGSKIYREIVNYQIKKYGGTLKDDVDIIPFNVLNNRVAARKKYKIKSRGIKGKNSKERRWSE